MIVFPILLSNCGKNEMDNMSVIDDYTVQDILYPKGAKLKQVSSVESVNSKKTGLITSQYEYDELGRISKVSCPMYKDGTPAYENGTIVGLFYYDIYFYNNKSQLEKIMNYHHNIYTGFPNLKNKFYTYDNSGNKLKVVIEYPLASPPRMDSTLYYYDNNRLKREDKYEDGYFGREPWRSELITYIEYEYNNQGELVKENYYSPEDNKPYSYSSSLPGDNKPYLIITHNYQNDVNVKTEYSNKIREIRRYYDKNNNLIYLESKELSLFSSMTSFVMKYEYY